MPPVLGTMMPEFCEAPHLPTSIFQPSFGSVFKEWEHSSHSLQMFPELFGLSAIYYREHYDIRLLRISHLIKSPFNLKYF